MALIRCDFFSDALGVGTSMTVLLPQPTTSQIGVDGGGSDGPPDVLYLLHGLSDDATAWSRYTSIERYAEAAGLAVVMPQVQRSFYCDQAHGARYWTFLTEELPDVVHTLDPGAELPMHTDSAEELFPAELFGFVPPCDVLAPIE